jgi:hypothetical protein
MRASDRDREQMADLVGERSRLRRVLRRLARGPAFAADATAVTLPADGPVLVGRSHRCDVVLEDPTVSRRHLELRPAGDGRWLALDVGSLNGTWLLDRRVGRVMVHAGDELWLGSCPVRLA